MEAVSQVEGGVAADEIRGRDDRDRKREREDRLTSLRRESVGSARRTSVIPSRIVNWTQMTRGSDRTWSLKRLIASVLGLWSLASTTLPLHRVLSAASKPRGASLGRVAS